MKRLYIKLGYKCNMQCKHCSQYNVKDTLNAQFDKKIFFDKLSIVFNCDSPPEKIVFLGGETLLYWDKIIKIINWIVNRNINIKFTIITNGLLLNNEKLEYLNKYSEYIELGLSYDFPNPLALRNKVISKNNLSVFKSYKGGKFVISVWGGNNKSLVDLYTEREKIFPENDIEKKTKFLLVNDIHSNGKINVFAKGEIFNAIKKLSKTKYFYDFLNNVFYEDFNYEKWVLGQDTYCGLHNNIVMDLIGNVYFCINSSEQIGTVDNLDNIDIERSIVEKIPLKCYDCDIVQYCKGHCLLGLRNGQEYVICEQLKELYRSCLIFRGFINE